MPTEKQQWLDKYNTYHAATEYNRQHYGKRIKQLKHMLEDEKFLEYLSSKECKEDILLFLAKSNEFDMYIVFNEQGEPYIADKDFGNPEPYMVEMIGQFDGEETVGAETFRKCTKRLDLKN